MAEIKKQELDFGPRVEGIANPDLELLPTLNEDEDLIKRLSQRDVSAPQIRQPEELNMNRVEGAPPPSTTSEMADRIEVLLEGERRRKGRKPQSIMLGDPVPLSPWAKQTQQGPLVGAPAATGFGVLADSGDLGPLDPQKIIQSQAKIPLAPGVDPSVLKQKDEPQPATGFGVLKTSGQLGPLDPIDLLQDIDDNLKYPIPMQRPDRAKGIGDIAADPDFDKLIADDVAVPRGTKKDLVKETEKALSFPDLGPGLQAPSMLGPVDDRTEDEINQDIIKDATKSFEDPGAKIDAQRSIASGDASAENMIAQALIGLGPAILGGIGSGELGAQAGLARSDKLEEARRKDLEAQRKAELELKKSQLKKVGELQDKMTMAILNNKLDSARDYAKDIRKVKENIRSEGVEAGQKYLERAHETKLKRWQLEFDEKKENIKNVNDANKLLLEKNSPAIKTYLQTRRSIENLKKTIQRLGGLKVYLKSKDKASGIRDVKLMFDFIRAADPGSVVRESEIETLRNAALGKYGKLFYNWRAVFEGGATLPEHVRMEMISIMQDAVRGDRDTALQREQAVKDQVSKLGLDASLVSANLPGVPNIFGTKLPPKKTSKPLKYSDELRQ